MVPRSHPRYTSLKERHLLLDGLKRGIVTEAGLMAHGRGEAFDYLLGERTTREAKNAEKAAVAMLLLAKNPVISVNGNAASLVCRDIVRLAKTLNAKLEVNLFYRTAKREKLIGRALRKARADGVYGLRKMHRVPGLGGERANIDNALWNADTVLVPLEDGDRTEALKKMGKKVIAIDLNPLSRTARKADITIVDNITRVVPNMISLAKEVRGKDLGRIVKNFNNKDNLKAVERLMRSKL